MDTDSYSKALGREQEYTKTIENSRAAKRRDETRQKLLKAHENVKNSGDLEAIIGLELAAILGERNRFANGDEQRQSLDKAINDLNIIKEHFDIVGDAKRYSEVNKQYPRYEERKPQNLPVDSARRAFASHTARLTNAKKVRSSELQKNIIEARKSAFKEAHKLYQERQAKALGIDLYQSQKKSRSR